MKVAYRGCYNSKENKLVTFGIFPSHIKFATSCMNEMNIDRLVKAYVSD